MERAQRIRILAATLLVAVISEALVGAEPSSAVTMVAARSPEADRSIRPYLNAIVGASFATLTDVAPPSSSIANEPLFTAGGGLGLSFERAFGGYRLEVEGRGRDQISSSAIVPGVGDLAVRATDSWSTLVNGWLDLDLTDRFTVYGGGGIGGGGYRTVIDGTALGFDITGAQVGSAFAWQAGGGIYYALSDRFAVDLGYRFFAIDDLPASARVETPSPIPISFNTAFTSSELLLTLRIYEPFRRWR